jgi:hypothetical protein
MQWMPGASVPLTEDAVGQWRARRDRARIKRQTFEPQWQRALARYSKVRYPAETYDVNALMDFRHVETKKAHLHHRTPEILLNPKDQAETDPRLAALVNLRQEYLNARIGAGPEGAGLTAVMHKTLVDAIAASAWLAIEVGYETRLRPLVDPMTGAPQLDPATGRPVEIPFWSRVFATRLSPKQILVPADATDSPSDETAWLGYDGILPLAVARQQPGWQLPPDWTPATTAEPPHFDHGLGAPDTAEPLVTYTKIWYRVAWFDPAVPHPDLYRCLVLVDGVEPPVLHQNSPHQALDANGALTPDSLQGNPIHMGTLRDMPDSCYIAGDLTIGEQLSKEVNKFRTQQIRNRAKRSPIVLVAESAGQPLIDKLTANEGPVPVPQEFIQPGGQQSLLAVANTGTEPRDNYAAQDTAERDWELALGTSQTSSGQVTKKRVTATEIRHVQGNASARYSTEQLKAREYFVALVRKFDTLLQRYATEDQVVRVLGQRGAALWLDWRALPGCYLYDILPDAGQFVDAQQLRQQTLDEYNLLRKDPRVNTETLLRKVATALGYDEGRFLAPPAEPAPQPASVALSFRGEDLVGPQSQAVAEILAQAGYTLSEGAIAALAKAGLVLAAAGPGARPSGPIGIATRGHGGSATVTEPVNQHQAGKSGAMPGTGVV